MSTIYIGSVNKYNHQELTINVPAGTDVNQNIRTFFGKEQVAEDIQPVQEDKPASDTDHFPFLTKKCYEEQRVDLVEAEFRAACKGTAESLWRALWSNENLGYVEVEPYDAAALYRGIENWYGKLPYKERNFREARKKR